MYLTLALYSRLSTPSLKAYTSVLLLHCVLSVSCQCRSVPFCIVLRQHRTRDAVQSNTRLHSF
jgi:hypothetical protein